MFRLLSFVALAALLIFLICGSASHKAHTHTAYLDGVTSPGMSSPTALESSPDLSPAISAAAPPQNLRSERLAAVLFESTPTRIPFAGITVLRI